MNPTILTTFLTWSEEFLILCQVYTKKTFSNSMRQFLEPSISVFDLCSLRTGLALTNMEEEVDLIHVL
jgi:hypothetical protein